jgi:hypothetical protein
MFPTYQITNLKKLNKMQFELKLMKIKRILTLNIRTINVKIMSTNSKISKVYRTIIATTIKAIKTSQSYITIKMINNLAKIYKRKKLTKNHISLINIGSESLINNRQDNVQQIINTLLTSTNLNTIIIIMITMIIMMNIQLMVMRRLIVFI